jgi:Domain of unknown function (DUF4249)
MKKLLYLFFLLKIAFVTEGCVDAVPFPTKAEQGYIVVDGGFNNSSDAQFVRLYRSKGYDASPDYIINANVSVIGSDGSKFYFDEINPGVYTTLFKERGRPGISYYVEISLPFGDTYRSEPEVMPEPIKPDSISFRAYEREELSSSGLKTSEKLLKIEINTPLKNKNLDAFFHWTIEDGFEFTEVNYTPLQNPPPRTCYYTRRVTPQERVAIASSKNLQLSYVNALNLNETSLEQFQLQYKQVHVWHVSQNVITEKAYNYWKDIDRVSFQVGSLFDVTAAYVKGNISNIKDKDEKVLGYFEVAATEKISRRLSVGEINRDYYEILIKDESPCDFNVKNNCRFGFKYEGRIEQICCDCPSYQISGWNNSLQRPNYWK